ncbi:MAG: dihydrodipicolinate synthase family protein [Desulfocapsaceae bacterium]
MEKQDLMNGVLAPVITPFDQNLEPDPLKLINHCRWLINNDVGLAVFGTNSEANSMSTEEKIVLLERLTEEGLPPERMMPGTGCCALPDTVALTRKAVDLGCGGVLMLPPFYYKNLSDDGLYRSFSEVIERVGDERLRVYLYHIPPIAQVGITLPVIERLLKDYPGTVVGIKDSSGDWRNTITMLDQFKDELFNVFPGSETFLLQGLRNGGAGCISATANVNPQAIAHLAASWREDNADAQQEELDRVRAVFQGYVMIPAMKAAVAHYSNSPGWRQVRPPLDPFSDDQSRELIDSLEEIGFTMEDL